MPARQQQWNSSSYSILLVFAVVALQEVLCGGRRVASAFQVRRSLQGEEALARHNSNNIDTKHLKIIQPQETTTTTKTPAKDPKKKKPFLTPLSTEPLLLVSTNEPILTADECEVLSRYFSGGSSLSNATKDDCSEKEQGQLVLEQLQHRLDDWIGRDPNEGAAVQPHFLHYDPPHTTTETESKIDSSPEALLPDGLHVDINNGYWFRYLTVLVYLTSNTNGGATNFPLARRRLDVHSNTKTTHGIKENVNTDLVRQAQFLLDQNVHHTRHEKVKSDDNDKGDSYNIIQACQRRLEQQAFDLFAADDDEQNVGIRILPRQGHVCAFVSVDTASGKPHPRSWHGAEALFSRENKQVLTFFYEVPVSQFQTQREFGQQVARRQQVLLEKYVQAN